MDRLKSNRSYYQQIVINNVASMTALEKYTQAFDQISIKDVVVVLGVFMSGWQCGIGYKYGDNKYGLMMLASLANSIMLFNRVNNADTISQYTYNSNQA